MNAVAPQPQPNDAFGQSLMMVFLAALLVLLALAITAGCEVVHRHEHQHHYDALPTLTKKGPDGKPQPLIVIKRRPRRSVDVR